MESVVVFGSSCFPSSLVSPNPTRNHVFQLNSFSKIKLTSRRNFGLLSRRYTTTTLKACIQPSDFGSSQAPIAPLQLESPIGQFLSQILVTHPHLVPAAVDQQLEQLQTDRDKETDGSSASSTELVLYRRIAELKANERTKALEEILYALVVQKFMDANVPLFATLTSSPSTSDESGLVNTSSSQEEKLERLHSPEAYEMIQNHLSLILGNRIGDSKSIAQISKLKVGQVYAASVMYGYFLKRVDQRFQLEKSMKLLPQVFDAEDSAIEHVSAEDEIPNGQNSTESVMNAQSHPEVSSWSTSTGNGNLGGVKMSRLRNYVMSCDGESIQRYATIRSKEAISIIEKHTEALFGRPEIVITPEGTVDSSRNESIKISFGGLRQLVLEAVTFGSFLWDVESYVDSRYHFVAN